MSKKKAKSSHNKKTEKDKVKPNNPATILPEDDDKPFDFGGLPARALRKNIGCG